MHAFARLPSPWIFSPQQGLATWHLDRFRALKALVALAVLRAQTERSAGEKIAVFPAPLVDVYRTAHLSRNDALKALQDLQSLGRLRHVTDLHKIASTASLLIPPPRTGTFHYSFVDDDGQFLPFPLKAVQLLDAHRCRSALHCLKLFLLVCALRSRESGGFTQVGYSKIEESCDIPLKMIRRAFSQLIDRGLLVSYPADTEHGSPRYFVTGLNRKAKAPSLASDKAYPNGPPTLPEEGSRPTDSTIGP